MTQDKLHVVGQRRDGSYETFDLIALEGEGVEIATDACEERGLRYIHSARPKPVEARLHVPCDCEWSGGRS